MSTVSGMSDVPSQHDGWDLHLAPGTVSGYKNVKFLKNNKTRPLNGNFSASKPESPRSKPRLNPLRIASPPS